MEETMTKKKTTSKKKTNKRKEDKQSKEETIAKKKECCTCTGHDDNEQRALDLFLQDIRMPFYLLLN